MSSTPVDLLDLKPEEFKKFLDSFDYVFSDCDGVLWQAKALPRVGEFFDLMQKHGKIVHYASNNSLRSRENYEAKFADANIENGFECLTIPSIAIAEYLKAANMTKKIYCVACDEAVKMLQSYDFECVTGPAVGPESFVDYIKFLEDDPEIGAVIFDSDINGNLAKLHKAATYLKRPDVLFLNGASDKTVHFKKGYSTLGVSFFTEAVAEHVNRQPVELAKPSKEFGQLVMKRVGATDPSRVLFIGDMIDQDIGLGKNTGFQTLMVLTHIPKEVMLAHKTIRPDYYAESLGSIVPLL